MSIFLIKDSAIFLRFDTNFGICGILIESLAEDASAVYQLQYIESQGIPVQRFFIDCNPVWTAGNKGGYVCSKLEGGKRGRPKSASSILTTSIQILGHIRLGNLQRNRHGDHVQQ